MARKIILPNNQPNSELSAYISVNHGLEQLARAEVKEIISVDAVVCPTVLEIKVDDLDRLLYLASRLQSGRRILIALEKHSSVADFKFKDNFEWKDYFSSDLSFKVEVEKVKGNENRLVIVKEIAGKIYAALEQKNIFPKLELKKPDLYVIIYFNGTDYFAGIDLCGKELDSRHYRVFTNPASFKGDLAYYFVRKTGFKPGEKLLIGFAKDGTLAIEAGLFNLGLPVLSSHEPYSFRKFPRFKEISPGLLNNPSADKNTKIFAFDPNQQNILAGRKNSKLAGIFEGIDFQKYSLDELDLKFSEGEFDHLIFQVTTKDEDKLNEIYYQASYILKKKGTLLLISRKNWDISVSNKFKLLSDEELVRGESAYRIRLFEKK